MVVLGIPRRENDIPPVRTQSVETPSFTRVERVRLPFVRFITLRRLSGRRCTSGLGASGYHVLTSISKICESSQGDLVLLSHVLYTLSLKSGYEEGEGCIVQIQILIPPLPPWRLGESLSLKSGYEEGVQIQILIPPLPPWVKIGDPTCVELWYRGYRGKDETLKPRNPPPSAKRSESRAPLC